MVGSGPQNCRVTGEHVCTFVSSAWQQRRLKLTESLKENGKRDCSQAGFFSLAGTRHKRDPHRDSPAAAGS